MTIRLTGNDMIPKVVQISQRDDTMNVYQFQDSPISVSLTINNKNVPNIHDLQSYFWVMAESEQPKDGETVDVQMQFLPCKEISTKKNKDSYYKNNEFCLPNNIKLKTQTNVDFSNQDDPMDNENDTQFEVVFARCQGKSIYG